MPCGVFRCISVYFGGLCLWCISVFTLTADSGTDTVSETDNSSTAFSLIESHSDSLSLLVLPGPGLALGATATQVFNSVLVLLSLFS